MCLSLVCNGRRVLGPRPGRAVLLCLEGSGRRREGKCGWWQHRELSEGECSEGLRAVVSLNTAFS